MDIKDVIKNDKTGEWCHRFARNVDGADIETLQNAVIEKDVTGECNGFYINGSILYIRDYKEGVLQ